MRRASQPFEITDWVGDGACIFLDDAAPSLHNTLEVRA